MKLAGAGSVPGSISGNTVSMGGVSWVFAGLGQETGLSLVPNGAGGSNVVASNVLFDAAYYLQQNPDAANGGVDPLLHYVASRQAEGRTAFPA